MSATKKEFYKAIKRSYRLLGNWYRVAVFHNRSESTIMRWHREEKAPAHDYIRESHIRRTKELAKVPKVEREAITKDQLKALFH